MKTKFLGILLVFLLIFTLGMKPNIGVEIKPKVIRYNFKSQAMILANEVFPTIERVASDYKLIPYNKKKGTALTILIGNLVDNYGKQGKLWFARRTEVRLFIGKNRQFKFYTLQVTIFLVEPPDGIIVVDKYFVAQKELLDKVSGEHNGPSKRD